MRGGMPLCCRRSCLSSRCERLHRLQHAALPLALLLVATLIGRASAIDWTAGMLVTNHEENNADYLRVLDIKGSFVEDVKLSDAPQWTADDNIAWAVASADAARVYLVTNSSHRVFSVGVAEPHTVDYVTVLPGDVKGVKVSDVDSLTVDSKGHLYVGVSVGCLDNAPTDCIGNYVLRYSLSTTTANAPTPQPTKIEAFPFVTHDLAMSPDNSILYGLDKAAEVSGARAIRQLNLTTMMPLPSFVVRNDSRCSAIAAGGPQGPIVACHGDDHPIDTKPAAVGGKPPRQVKSQRSNAVATATRLATNTAVNATYVWAYSPRLNSAAAYLTKVNTSTGEPISGHITTNVPSDVRALTVIPGKETPSGKAAGSSVAYKAHTLGRRLDRLGSRRRPPSPSVHLLI